MTALNVSVIIPVRNGAHSIEACLESLLKLDYEPPPEIIVVENNSTDETLTILSRYVGRIKILTEKIPGSAAARNLGITKAKNDYIAFTDADCVVDKRWLNALIPPLQDENVGAVGGRIKAIQTDGPIALFGDQICDHDRAINNSKTPYIMTGNCAFRRQLLGDVGKFDIDMLRGHDVDLGWRIYQWGYQIVYTPLAIICHQHYDSLWKLFCQGTEHGYSGVKVLKRHKVFLKNQGYNRFRWQQTGLWKYLITFPGSTDPDSVYSLIFNIGKKIGKLAASIRFRHIEF